MSEDWLTKRKTMKQNVVLWLLDSYPLHINYCYNNKLSSFVASACIKWLMSEMIQSVMEVGYNVRYLSSFHSLHSFLSLHQITSTPLHAVKFIWFRNKFILLMNGMYFNHEERVGYSLRYSHTFHSFILIAFLSFPSFTEAIYCEEGVNDWETNGLPHQPIKQTANKN